MPEEQQEKHIHTPVTDTEGYQHCEECGEYLGIAGVKPEFQIDSHDAVNWFLRKQSESDAQMFAIHAAHTAYVEQMNKRLKEIERRKMYLDWRFGPQVREYMTRYLNALGKRSEKLEFGTIKLKKNNASIKLANRDSALNWVLALPKKLRERFTRTTTALAWDELKAYIQEEPERFEGITFFEVVPEEPNAFSYDTGVTVK